MLDFRSFRKNAITFSSAVAFAATTLLPFSVAAQQTLAAATSKDAVNGASDCTKYKPGELMADTKCEIMKGVALDKELACKGQIIAAARAKKIVIDFPPPPIGQFCVKAKDLGLKVSSL